jgi:hypothetical protein
MNTYIPFEIWIDAPAASVPSKGTVVYPMRVIDSPAGPAEGSLALKFSDKTFKTRLAGVQGEGVDLDQRKAFGEMLYLALFNGKIRDAWMESRGRVAAGQASGLRLRLWFNDPALAALPWELLWDADNGFLATTAGMALSRFLPVPEPPIFTLERPLRVALAVASPVNLPKIPDSEIDALVNTLQNLAPNVELILVRDANVPKLQAALQNDIHVLHFLGHGQPGRLALLGRVNEPVEFIGDEAFAQLFLGRRSLRLVVLNACASSISQDGNLFKGIGPALIQKRIPAVVAMQYPTVQADSASRFSQAFYRALAEGLPVDIAVNEGRQLLSAGPLLGTRDWSTPVLYMGTRSGAILELIKPDTSQEERAWQVVSAAATASGESGSLKQLSGNFAKIADLQRNMAALIELEDQVRTARLSYAPCESVVEKARGAALMFNGNRFAQAWKPLRQNQIADLQSFLQGKEALAVSTGLENLDAHLQQLENAIQQAAMGDMLNRATAFGSFLVNAEAKVREAQRQVLESLLSTTDNTLGKFIQS